MYTGIGLVACAIDVDVILAVFGSGVNETKGIEVWAIVVEDAELELEVVIEEDDDVDDDGKEEVEEFIKAE